MAFWFLAALTASEAATLVDVWLNAVSSYVLGSTEEKLRFARFNTLNADTLNRALCLLLIWKFFANVVSKSKKGGPGKYGMRYAPFVPIAATPKASLLK